MAGEGQPAVLSLDFRLKTAGSCQRIPSWARMLDLWLRSLCYTVDNGLSKAGMAVRAVLYLRNYMDRRVEMARWK